MKLVLVNWVDATGGDRTGWRKIKKMKHKTDECQSVGFLLKQTELSVTVLPHKSGKQGDGEITIPRSWITGEGIVELAPRQAAFTPAPAHTDHAKLEEAKDE